MSRERPLIHTPTSLLTVQGWETNHSIIFASQDHRIIWDVFLLIIHQRLQQAQNRTEHPVILAGLTLGCLACFLVSSHIFMRFKTLLSLHWLPPSSMFAGVKPLLWLPSVRNCYKGRMESHYSLRQTEVTLNVKYIAIPMQPPPS